MKHKKFTRNNLLLMRIKVYTIKMLKFIYSAITSPKTSNILVSIMSLIIAFVGVSIENKVQEISQKELEVLENDREAYFFVEKNGYKVLDDKADIVTVTEYIIHNTGGRIVNAYVDTEAYIDIEVSTHDENFVDTVIYRLDLGGFCYTDTGFRDWYETETKSFNFLLKESGNLELMTDSLPGCVEKVMPGSRVNVSRKNVLKIVYSNYQNIKKQVDFILIGNVMEHKEEDEYMVRRLSTDIVECSEEEIDNIVKEIIYRHTKS